ncbi:MAG: DUF4255 domain-containing protein [Chloroflexi bacterium]|nr:DUF4255 domain-containing protein [Chloroflexota bacterium]
MFDDLDEVLRRLLVRELPIKNGDVNIEFDQPKREWSARLSRPTLNLFLHDLRENNTLRQNEWHVTRNGNGTATKTRSSARIDLHYMVTAWATEVDDEHRLLARALMALLRYPTLPNDLVKETLPDQSVPIPMRVAEQEALRNPADIWGAMDNELRPAITCVVTLALNPYQPLTGPIVKTRDLRFRQVAETKPQDQFWMVGGTLRAKSLKDARLRLVERGLDIDVAHNGDFVIGNLEEGTYTLMVSTEDGEPQQHPIVVPSRTYDIDLEGGAAKAG